MGVKRAVDMAVKLAEENPGRAIYTIGPLIHNPQVIELLAKKGVKVLDKAIPAKDSVVIIRTHGIPPETKKQFQDLGVVLHDATCPFVVKVQRIIEKYKDEDYRIIIIGDKGHAEVDSYLGYAGIKGVVISSVEEAKKIELIGDVCVVAQTTQDKKIFSEVVNIMKQKNANIKVFDTICSATNQRQKEALDLSNSVDAMIVVGGKNSANTVRLFEICQSAGTKTLFIERVGELDLKEVSNYETVGVTAGASTSNETIQEVVCRINEKCKTKK